MTNREKLLKLRHDFYLNGPVDYDSISYFASIERALEALEIIRNHVEVVEKEYEYRNDLDRIIQVYNYDLTDEEYELLNEVFTDDK